MRAGWLGQGPGGARPPQAAPQASLTLGAREPIIVACGERAALLFRVVVDAVVVAPSAGCAAGSALAAVIPSFVPRRVRPRGMGLVRAGPGGVNHRGARAAAGRGRRHGRRSRARPRPGPAHAASLRGWRQRRTCPSRIAVEDQGRAAPGPPRPWRCCLASLAAAGDDAVLELPRPRPGGVALDRLDHRPAQHPRALLGDVPADHLGVGLVVPRRQPGPRAQPPGCRGTGVMSPISATMTAASTGPMPGSCWIARVSLMPGQQVGESPCSSTVISPVSSADQLPQRGDLPRVRLGQLAAHPARPARARRRCPSRSPRCRAWPAPRGPGPCS